MNENGNYYFTNTEAGVVIYNKDFNLLLQMNEKGSGVGQLFNPTFTATDSENNIYILEAGNSRIQSFSGF